MTDRDTTPDEQPATAAVTTPPPAATTRESAHRPALAIVPPPDEDTGGPPPRTTDGPLLDAAGQAKAWRTLAKARERETRLAIADLAAIRDELASRDQRIADTRDRILATTIPPETREQLLAALNGRPQHPTPPGTTAPAVCSVYHDPATAPEPFNA